MLFNLIYVYINDNVDIHDYYYDSIDSVRNKSNVNIYFISNREVKIIEGFNSFNVVQVKSINYDRFKYPKEHGLFWFYTIYRFFLVNDFLMMNKLEGPVYLTEGDIYFQYQLDVIHQQVEDRNKIYSCRDSSD